MSNIEAIVDSLEKQIRTLLSKFEDLQQENAKLNEELARVQKINQDQAVLITEWEDKFETLKFTTSLLGSDDNKRETKLKINALIRDLDHCIAQLAE